MSHRYDTFGAYVMKGKLICKRRPLLKTLTTPQIKKKVVSTERKFYLGCLLNETTVSTRTKIKIIPDFTDPSRRNTGSPDILEYWTYQDGPAKVPSFGRTTTPYSEDFTGV